MVTGTPSFQRMERIGKIQEVVDDESYPLEVRRLAEAELDKINDGAPVAPSYEAVCAALATPLGPRTPSDDPGVDVEPTPEEAAARPKGDRPRRIKLLSAHRTPAQPVKRSVRALVMTWADLDGWTGHYDPDDVAAKLTEAEWAMVERVMAESTTFFDAVRASRTGAA